MKLHEKLKLIRKKLNKTQQEIYKETQIPVSTYQKYERGEREAPAHVLIKIIQTYDINPDWIVWGKGGIFRSRIESFEELKIAKDFIDKFIENNE